MTIKLEQYLKEVEAYSKKIEMAFQNADYIVSRVGKSDHQLVNSVYESATIRMCILYETFASDAYKIIVSSENIVFNHPWDYTRKIAGILGINIKDEYARAHASWAIYNYLKHVNNKTRREFKVIEYKHKLKNHREIAKHIKTALLKLLNKLKTPAVVLAS